MVFDASAYLRASQKHQEAIEYLRAFVYGSVRLYVPPHFVFEVANALRNGVVGRQSSENDARLALNAALQMKFEVESDPKLATDAFDFGIAHGVTVYDAAYAVLAQKRNATLVTADSGLRQAAERSGIPVAFLGEIAA